MVCHEKGEKAKCATRCEATFPYLLVEITNPSCALPTHPLHLLASWFYLNT